MKSLCVILLEIPSIISFVLNWKPVKMKNPHIIAGFLIYIWGGGELNKILGGFYSRPIL